MFQPKASRPISSASNFTSGARQSRPVSSTMRRVRSGADRSRQRSQTPSVSSAVTELASRAVVRLSLRAGGLPASTVATPPAASATAAVSAAGPPPTTIASNCRLSAVKAPVPCSRYPTSTPGRPYAMHAGSMTETTDHPTHPLAVAFARPKRIAAACVIALAALGWLYLALAVADMGGVSLGPGMGFIDGLPRAVQAICRPLFGEQVPHH